MIVRFNTHIRSRFRRACPGGVTSEWLASVLHSYIIAFRHEPSTIDYWNCFRSWWIHAGR
jgi:hypothetical protein